MKAICKDDSYTFRNRLTIGKEYEVLKSYNDSYAGYLMFDVECDNGDIRTYRANRFTLIDNEYTRKEVECPLVMGFCNEDHKDCNICIAEEEEWQREQCRRDCRQ